MLYRIGPGNTGTYDARIELERIDDCTTAVVLQSQGGGARNSGYSPALRQILARLLNYPGTITRVLIHSERARRNYAEEDRILFRGSDLAGLSLEEAVTKIRVALRRFDQPPGTRGGNSTKQVRIETSRSLHSIRSTLQLTAWDGDPIPRTRPRHRVASDHEPDLPDIVETALNALPEDAENRRYAEGDPRIIDHLRIERRRNSKAARDKRAAVRAANNGRLACENPACETDWYLRYTAEVADSIFDVHHTVPLAEMAPDHETLIEDLLCLCANCHRAEHRRMVIGPPLKPGTAPDGA
jgi:hypothetical protein